MPKYDIYDYGFGTVWSDVHVSYREGYYTSVTDYHEHSFYEINLILSGNVRILLGDRAEEGMGNRIILTRPGTPHYISCQPDVLYSRLYLVFTDDFVADYLPEWHQLSALFGDKGRIAAITQEQTDFCKSVIEQIGSETMTFRKRLLTYYLLSYIGEIAGGQSRVAGNLPAYIVEVLTYLENHYSDRVTAAALAERLHIGRTTLMTGFHKYTGSTIGEYLTHCRLKHAIRLLREGMTLECTAERCGFADSSGLIRSFKRCFGMTPRQYMEIKDE